MVSFSALSAYLLILTLYSFGRGDPHVELLQTEFVTNGVTALMVLGDKTDVDSKDIEFDGRDDFAICRGDSGAPAYIVVNGEPLIAGLLSPVRARFGSRFGNEAYRECAGKRVCAKDASVGQLTRLWDAKESWIEQQLGFQCYENGGIADCNRRRTSRPRRPPTEPGGPSRDCPNCQVP